MLSPILPRPETALVGMAAPPPLSNVGFLKSLAYSPPSEKVCLALSKLQSMCDSVSHSGTMNPPGQLDGVAGQIPRSACTPSSVAVSLSDSVRVASLQPTGHCVAPKYRADGSESSRSEQAGDYTFPRVMKKAGARLTCMITVSHLHGSCKS
ncbi:hypothetical protein DHEL01_v209068 [Diaporthe helianthi]|uniref:Uncharacterized protein n=1 Tax=Diaporthe helianthi TaxID=158607 RepID=A0A2P5HQP1_DIAHE|nr:hypothetical protein DHEL01_v209068 [Diaporthe helianthi]